MTESSQRKIGDFVIVGELGRGGMGVVYEAHQRSLNRRVALKVLSNSLGLTTKAIMRFRREAEAAAKLHHTNIVPVFATGEEKGIHYYAMEMIAGPSLDQVIRHLRGDDISPAESSDGTGSIPNWVDETIAYEAPPSEKAVANVSSHTTKLSASGGSSSEYFDNVASMIADVADALNHAHDHGVIHRDIKPSNLLLGPDGRLSLNDFGLARVLEQPGMTITGEFVGTPRYMSPEQITAGRAPLDHRTDIYSLGATLYELLALKPVFDGKTRDEVIGQILHKDPVRPRKHNKRIPLDLETICLKALERDPDRRYATAEKMADDLKAYVNRFAISAKRVGPARRMMKWVQRNKTVSALLLLLCLMTGFAGYQSVKNYAESQAEISQIADRVLRYSLDEQWKDARAEIDEAIDLGADEGQIRLMTAQVDLLEKRNAKVGLDLEAIDGPIRDTTAYHAMRVVVCVYVGREAECFQRLPLLYRRPADTYQDRLLRGWAASVHLPSRAVDDLRAAKQMRDSDVVGLLLAEALVGKAFASVDKELAIQDMEEAMGLIEANRLRPAHPWSEALFVFASMVQADLLAKDEDDRLRRLREFRDDAERLKKWWTTSENASAVRTVYLIRSRSAEQLFSEFDEAVPRSPYAFVHRTIELFRENRDPDALRAFIETPAAFGTSIDHMQAYIQMSSSDADRQVLADSFFSRSASRTGDPFAAIYRHFDVWAMQLLGDDARARELAKGHAIDESLESTWPLLGVTKLVTGELNAEQLIESCAGDRNALVHAYFAAGVEALSEGDRTEAKRRFNQAVETGRFVNYVFTWSRAFLQRMEDDPDWLPWLPSEPEESASNK